MHRILKITLGILGGAAFALAPFFIWSPRDAVAPIEREARVEPVTFVTAIPEVIPEKIATPIPAQPGIATVAPTALPRDIVIDLPSALAPRDAPNQNFSAFDFLRDYLTNRTYPSFVEATPWTNSSVNVAQYQGENGGVSYWDFWSEEENWDSPFFMWQRDNGKWDPYGTVSIRNSAGQTTKAYLLLDRAGPGALDLIYFAQDGIWMPQIAAQVKTAPDQTELIEWGNLAKLGNMRIEVDERVVFDAPAQEWFSGRAMNLTPDLARVLVWRHREFGTNGSIVPVLYQKRLRVLLKGGTGKPKWFMATGVRFPDATRVQSFDGKLPVEEMSRLAQNVIKPETFITTLDDQRAFDLQSPGAIRLNGAGTLSAMQFRLAKKVDPKGLTLTIKYADQIAAQLPLIAFFGDHDQLTLHRSTPIGIVETEDAYIFYSNYPMPFQNGMTLELASSQPITVSARIALARETRDAQFWVRYDPKQKLAMYGPDYQVALPGDGKLVGIVLATDDQDLDKIPKIFAPGKPNEEDAVKRAWAMGYLEGNLHLIDGAGNDRMYGGHEEWASGAFYFNQGYTNPPGGSNRAFGGILRYKGGKDGYATVFRYFNDLSALRFKNGLQMNFGHGTWQNNFPVRYGTTVYYYKQVNGSK